MSESNCYSMSLTWRVTVTLHSLYMIRNCQTLPLYPLPVLLGLPWVYLSSLSCVCSKRLVPTQRIQSFLALRSPTAHLFCLFGTEWRTLLSLLRPVNHWPLLIITCHKVFLWVAMFTLYPFFITKVRCPKPLPKTCNFIYFITIFADITNFHNSPP